VSALVSTVLMRTLVVGPFYLSRALTHHDANTSRAQREARAKHQIAECPQSNQRRCCSRLGARNDHESQGRSQQKSHVELTETAAPNCHGKCISRERQSKRRWPSAVPIADIAPRGGRQNTGAPPSPNSLSTASTPPAKCRKVLPMCPVRDATYVSGRSLLRPCERLASNDDNALVIRDGKFWTPLIALYSGMRVGEIVIC
jgi:hypothetical protein